MKRISNYLLLQRGIIRKKVRLLCRDCSELVVPFIHDDDFGCPGCGRRIQPARADDIIEETVQIIPPNPNDKGTAFQRKAYKDSARWPQKKKKERE